MRLTYPLQSYLAAAIGIALIALSVSAVVYALVGAHDLIIQIMGEPDAP